jgi:hypothetical protein
LNMQVEVDRQYLSVLYELREVRQVDGHWVPIEDKSRLGEGTPWATVYKGDAHVVFGHDSHRGFQVTLTFLPSPLRPFTGLLSPRRNVTRTALLDILGTYWNPSNALVQCFNLTTASCSWTFS